jgi:hypothetical protein
LATSHREVAVLVVLVVEALVVVEPVEAGRRKF